MNSSSRSPVFVQSSEEHRLEILRADLALALKAVALSIRKRAVDVCLRFEEDVLFIEAPGV